MTLSRCFKALGAVVGLVAIFAALSPMAQAAKPDPGYEQFAGCPNPFTEDSTITTCLRQEIIGGRFKMGNKNVKIEHTITLTGGIRGTSTGEIKWNSEGGLTKVKQTVPGGVTGLTGLTWLLEFFGVNALSLYAVTETAGTPILASATSVILPIKVHLETPSGVLGSNCRVGSDSAPMVLHLTTGTSGKLTGKESVFSFEPVREIGTFTGGKYVDGTFTAPGANGCVLTLFGFIPISINGLVDSQSGLPAESGVNETEQEFKQELTNSEFAYE
jgi:hypothetical protein